MVIAAGETVVHVPREKDTGALSSGFRLASWVDVAFFHVKKFQ